MLFLRWKDLPIESIPYLMPKLYNVKDASNQVCTGDSGTVCHLVLDVGLC